MAAIAPLVLADGQASPANKTFTPMDCTSQLATWTDRSSGIALGMPSVTLSVVSKSGQPSKITGKVSLPVMEVISGADGGYTPSPKVAYTCIGKVELTFPDRSTLQNRKDTRAFVKNLLLDTVIQKAVEEFERPY
uniref:Uncharacterized protein n=1 Tax=Leviviridae sp. TaxID=2027243 RepID=A0A514DAN7_9VIRU|nr:MAG: hypothetical protein H4Bulk46484e3101_000003 [Leviviridae sp.]